MPRTASAKVSKKLTKPAKPSKPPSAKSATAKRKDDGVPLSQFIRKRIQAKKARFHANDNIAEFIQPGEIDGLIDEVTEKLQGVLESLVIDTESDHNTRGTAFRVAKMYINEVFTGRYTPEPNLTKFPNISRLNELMIIGPIAVKSACSHHLCPIIGLSKYARITEWVMCRPQIQEEAVVELANLLEEKMKPTGLALVMEADHFCMQWRGVKDLNSKMVNSVMRGSFLKDANLRREFLALMDKQQGKQ
jgi:GTP cyclohydrolase I